MQKIQASSLADLVRMADRLERLCPRGWRASAHFKNAQKRNRDLQRIGIMFN